MLSIENHYKFLLMNFIMQINYANSCPVKLIRCPTKMKIWKDICPVKGEKLFPALHREEEVHNIPD